MTWNQQKGQCPRVDQVFVITNPTLRRNWNAYKYRLQDQSVEEHYHGRAAGSNLRMVRPRLMLAVKLLIIRARSTRQKFGPWYF